MGEECRRWAVWEPRATQGVPLGGVQGGAEAGRVAKYWWWWGGRRACLLLLLLLLLRNVP